MSTNFKNIWRILLNRIIVLKVWAKYKKKWYETYTLKETYIVYRVQKYGKYFCENKKKISDSKCIKIIIYLTKIKNNKNINPSINTYSEYILSLFFKENQIRINRKLKLKKLYQKNNRD